MFLVPLFFVNDFFIGTTTGYSSDVSWLGYFQCGMEEEVGLPMLEGGAVGGEDRMEGGSGCG